MNRLDVLLSRLAARQYGLITRTQALEIGLTPRQIDRRLASGALVLVRCGVYRVVAAPRSFEQALMAACLATGGVASHRAAAALLTLRGIEKPPVEITVAGGSHRALEGVVIHHAQSLRAVDLAKFAGIPMTKPARTLLDLGAVASNLVQGAAEDALFRGMVSVDGLWRVLERSGGRGRRGAAVLRRILEARDPAQAPTESTLEDEIVAVLRRFGLPEPVRQHKVPRPGRKPLRLDIAYPAELVDIEGDGLRWHTSTQDAQRDRERANFLVTLGYVILRFTVDDVRRRPGEVAGQVEKVRAARVRRAG
jgi:very-short-patch-repair endonuclease